MTTEPLANPHDRFFKQFMAQTEIATDFIRAFLPSDVVDKISPDEMREIMIEVFPEEENRS